MSPGSHRRALRWIHLYDGAYTDALRVGELGDYLGGLLPTVRVRLHGEFFRHWLGASPAGRDQLLPLAKRLASARVHDPSKNERNADPLFGEIDFEARFLGADRKKPAGVFYDGYALVSICSELIGPELASLEHCHIILTNQLFGTWDEADCRYHARVAVFGYPAIVSTTGLVEAPAGPREYYLRRQLGEDEVSLAREFAGRFLDYDDPRTTEAIKGYLLQAVFHHATGEAFCADENCRLFNAHWQEQLIRAQLGERADLCPRHRRMLESMF